MSLYKPLHQYFLVLSLTTTLITLLSSAQHEPLYENCTQSFECGDPGVVGQLKYPFWGINRASYCGLSGFELKCINNKPIITVSSHDLQLIATDPQDHSITVASAAFSNTLCPPSLFNNKNFTNLSIVEINLASFTMDTSVSYLTILYECPSYLRSQLSLSDQESCTVDNAKVDVYYATHTVNPSLASRCSSYVTLPIPLQSVNALEGGSISLREALNKGFELDYFVVGNSNCNTCVSSGGQCGFNATLDGFTCHCPDKPYPLECPYNKRTKRGGKSKTLLVIGVSIGVVALLALLGGFLLYMPQKWKSIPQNKSVEDSLKNHASVVPKRYTYKNLKKMTKSFKEKLGEGGYGTVFKGALHNGRVVAVKVWKQSKGDGQEFVNEVLSISGTSHVNVVPLLGFCFEGHKRALIYEFMSNGSLEKFIQGRYSNEYSQSLPARKLFEIGIGIGRGLEYLHRGCNTRIVHLDIKPHNILLDEEFIPKISDFGLAKSIKQKDSVISMSGARGTAGYIAPEVFFRTYGGVSNKSDVYSFGMMLLEMVGCKNTANEENNSEMYFPQWIYNQLEQETITIDGDRTLNEEEKKLERIMIVVGLWCIQTNPMNRPSMSRVLEMLEGKVEALEVPPMPILNSPPWPEQTDDDSANFLSSTSYVTALNG